MADLLARLQRFIDRVVGAVLPSAVRDRADDSSAAPQIQRRITALDGWRGISILLVIVGHLANIRYWSGGAEDLKFAFLDVLSIGGVCIFFVISGFIIVRLAFDERERSGSFSTSGFYTRRFFRIIPPLWTYLLFVLLFSALGLISQHSRQTLLGTTFICNLSGVQCGRFAAHTWSLAYEEQFYILLPLLMWWRPKATFTCLFAVLLSVPFLRRAYPGHIASLLGHAAFFCSFICAGALMAAHRDIVERASKSRLGRHAWVVALTLLVIMFWIDAAGRHAWDGSLTFRARMLLVPTLEPFCVAWLVGSSVYRLNALTRLLDWSPLNWIGRVSFSLYLWQALFANSPTVYLVTSPLLFPPLMLVCAALSYRFVELPFVRIGKLVAGAGRRRAVPPAMQSA
jgi:peptidoglycan/LPS O-acetylase OafA/YrhL